MLVGISCFIKKENDKQCIGLFELDLLDLTGPHRPLFHIIFTPDWLIGPYQPKKNHGEENTPP